MAKPRSTKAVLIAARDLISDPKHWTKGMLARKSKRGVELNVTDEDAACFCLAGAISRACGVDVYPSKDGPLAQRAARKLAVAIDPDAASKAYDSWDMDYVIFGFNDAGSRKHDDVLAALDRAIEACR
jgi:hypothetical protein